MKRSYIVSILCFALFLALVGPGCAKKEDQGSASNTSLAVTSSTPAAPPENRVAPAPQPVVAAAPKISCDTLVPAALREKYFAGTTLTEQPLCPGCPIQCLFKKEGEIASPSAIADCRNSNQADWFAQASKALSAQKSYVKMEGLGRLAFTTNNNLQVLFVPANLNCVITITWLNGGEKMIALAKDLAANLSPALLGK